MKRIFLATISLITVFIVLSVNTYAWSSVGGSTATHEFIVARGISILEHDVGSATAGIIYANGGSGIIMEYADKPDSDEIGTAFSGHFYDPTTDSSWGPNGSTNNAKWNFVNHANTAKAYWKSNRTYAFQQLGRAIHFLSDCSETHHTSNLVAGLTNHSEYESWVNNNRFNYILSSVGPLSTYTSIPSSNFQNTCLTVAKASAQNAYAYKQIFISDYPSSMWGDVTRATLQQAQADCAQFLYVFLREVGENVPK